MPNWVSLLKAVPWTDVISNAPVVADGARRLWKTVARKVDGSGGAVPEPVSPVEPPVVEVPEAEDVSAPVTQVQLEAALTQLAQHGAAQWSAAQARDAQLQQQLAESAELLQRLAEQNGQLAQGLEALRRRLRWTFALALVGGVAALAGWGHLLLAGR